ncbi:MAG TPA: hypothetical protein VHB99_06460 [Pirellulales bacterium]|nr:hypothetical protein [Pirellulales bacterium]
MNLRKFGPSVALALAAWAVSVAAACADEQAAKQSPKKPAANEGPAKHEPLFVRLVRDDAGTVVALQTSTVRYVAPDAERKGLIVDLIGVVHIGEKEYYDRLNKQFEQYDSVLYELVAPEGTRVPKGGAKSKHPVGQVQQMMKNVLELDFQLDHVDYHQKNFQHADMSPDDFAKSMADRNESFFELFLKMMAQGMVQQSKKGGGTSDADLLLALFDRNRALALKRVFAEQFEDLDGAMGALDGPEGSTLVTERNKKALEVLKKDIDDGQKRLAIFYGAGHMPDMAERLEQEFGLKREGREQWLTAWNMQSPPKKKTAEKSGKKKSAANQPDGEKQQEADAQVK